MLDKKTVKLHLKKARNHLEVMPRRDDYKVDFAMITVLGEMALFNIIPDGTFSDVECCVWEVFRRIIDKSNDLMYYICNVKRPYEPYLFLDEDEGIQTPAVYANKNEADRICRIMNENSRFRTYEVRLMTKI